MVSMKDVAVECGVSIATVSKALNDHSDISEETRRKVKEAANRLGYYPNSAARALKTNRSYNIGVLLNNVNSDFFIEAVKIARKYQPCKDSLCIISGACYSSFKNLINVGSNISSSPGKVSINVLDPAKVAIMVATTPVFKYVDIKKVIELTSNKNKGMGGIDTKGQARKIY